MTDCGGGTVTDGRGWLSCPIVAGVRWRVAMEVR
ncbi:hypothetical protein BJ982_006867 [Sphaerisporangium siamense]|uniref:Uncharacterized protein n=1 Tax=Sphaerisporangium siamense TaxID=795645 RepID=A0A7W7GBR8_9ACTN|nr:hypothetical protein [Sphaerisporangium siamense]